MILRLSLKNRSLVLQSRLSRWLVLLAMTNAWSLHASRPKLPPGGVLFALADDLLADIFTEWIPMEDVCRLDSAVCCAKMSGSITTKESSGSIMMSIRTSPSRIP